MAHGRNDELAVLFAEADHFLQVVFRVNIRSCTSASLTSSCNKLKTDARLGCPPYLVNTGVAAIRDDALGVFELVGFIPHLACEQ